MFVSLSKDGSVSWPFSFQDNNVERAADWIFSHADELDQPMETDQDQPEQNTSPKCHDGNSSMSWLEFLILTSADAIFPMTHSLQINACL